MSPFPAQEDKVEVVSAFSVEEQQQDEEEAPEEPDSYQEEVTYEQPRDLLLEQTDIVTEPQALGFQQAQTPEVLNGGSHQSEHSPSQKGVCGFMGFCVCVCVCIKFVWEQLNILYESASE